MKAQWIRSLLYFCFAYYLLSGLLALIAPTATLVSLGLERALSGGVWPIQLAGVVTAVFGAQFWFAARDPSANKVFISLAALGQFLVPIVVLTATLRGELPDSIALPFIVFDSVLGLLLLLLLRKLWVGDIL